LKIGLFGGTFDPIHNGHIKVAQAAKNNLQLDKVILIPAGDPPHKAGKNLSDKMHRLDMARLAAEPLGAEVSDWELLQTGKSYSVDTVRHFQATCPRDELFFIIGADSFYDIPTWWHYRELLELCSFVVVARPDTDKNKLLAKYAGDEKPPRVFYLQDILVDISSTAIRDKVRRGEDISTLVPPAVQDYIHSHKLYTCGG